MTCNLIILVSHKNASVILSSFNWSVDAAAFDNPGWTMWIMYSVLYTLLTFSLMIDSWFSVPNSYLFLAFVVPLRNIRPIICSGLEWSQLTHFCACPLTAYKSLIRAPGWSSCENFRWNNSTLTTLLMSSTLIAITSAISPHYHHRILYRNLGFLVFVWHDIGYLYCLFHSLVIHFWYWLHPSFRLVYLLY